MSNTWRQEPEIPVGRLQCSLLSDGNRLYALSGIGDESPLSRVFSFDLNSGTWSELPSIIDNGLHVAHLLAGGKIYQTGGGSAKTIAYGIASGTNEELSSMPVSRLEHGAVYHEGKMYVVGGSRSSGTTSFEKLNSLDIYDIASDSWSSGAPMSKTRDSAAAVAHGGKIYLFGGTNSNQRPSLYLATAEVMTLPRIPGVP